MEGSERSQHTHEPWKTLIGCIFMISCITFFAQAIVAAKTDECRAEIFIPICIFNYGTICIFLLLSLCRKPCCNIVCCSIPIFFFCCWFLAVNMLVFFKIEPNYNKTGTKPMLYCNKTFHLFAFWSTNLSYSLLGLLFFSLCCCKPRQRDDEAQTVQVQYYRHVVVQRFIVYES